MKKNILVFPCGSEIALEIYRSLQYSTHFNLIGGNSVEDHGRFIYNDYIGNIPFISSPDFVSKIKKIVIDSKIDAIYPAMDEVNVVLKKYEKEIGCKIIGSSLRTVNICLSKSKTYNVLKDIINVPRLFSINENIEYPVFAKPDNGYGSKGAKKINDEKLLFEQLELYPNSIFCEYLQGKEYTVDCFTDRNGSLRFLGPRLRKRIMNGISVNTIPVSLNIEKFEKIVELVNKHIVFRGAWFLQLKENNDGELFLLEIAARLGGSSSIFRIKGVNFALLTLFDAFDIDVDILENTYSIELDRALDNIYNIDIQFTTVYVDFDDCLIINEKVNFQLIAFLYLCVNENKKIILITKHLNDLKENLNKYRLSGLFDKIIHVESGDSKFRHIKEKDCIFIDDSFAERKEVKEKCKISVFSPDAINGLRFNK